MEQPNLQASTEFSAGEGDKKLLTDAVGATAGAAIGLFVAGPIGTLVGAAAGPVLARLTEIAARRVTAFWEAFRTGLEEEGLTEQEWAERAAATPAVENAVAELLNAASHTVDQKRLAILGRLAARVPTLDDESAAAIAYFAGVFNSLSEVHLKMLSLAEVLWPERKDELGLRPDELLETMGPERPLARSIMRVLELHGLVVDNARLSGDIVGVFWEVTDLGRSFLALSQSSSFRGNGQTGAAPK